MVSNNLGHLFVYRLHHRPDLLGVTALVLLRLFQRHAAVTGEGQGDMVAAGRFIGGVRHLAPFDDSDPGSTAADIHHARVVEL